MGELARVRAGRPVRFVLAALLVTAALGFALAACGGGSSGGVSAGGGGDPLAGYWIGAGKGAQMTMVAIFKKGDTYTVVANPNRDVGVPKKDGDSLVVDTHVVTMKFSPQPGDKLGLEFTGDMFKQPQTVTLSRVSETEYKDGAVAYGLVVLRRGLAMWKAGGASKYPPADEVTPDGMLAKMIAWPVNLFTNGPMVQKASAGDFTYNPTQDGKSYSLKGYLSDGGTLGE